jgi:hypothetical protein
VPSPEATATPEAQAETWNYVAFGDNLMAGVPTIYAAHIEEDLDVKVDLDNRQILGVLTSSSLLTRLQNNEGLRQSLGAAQIVTFYGQPAEITGFCWGVDDAQMDCSSEALASFRADYEAIMDELLALRGSPDVILQTTDFFMPFYNAWTEQGIVDECSRCWQAINDIVHEVAAERGIAVAAVATVFNGPNMDQDAMDKGYLESAGQGIIDGTTNKEGRVLIADLLRELGYEPARP